MEPRGADLTQPNGTDLIHATTISGTQLVNWVTDLVPCPPFETSRPSGPAFVRCWHVGGSTLKRTCVVVTSAHESVAQLLHAGGRTTQPDILSTTLYVDMWSPVRG